MAYTLVVCHFGKYSSFPCSAQRVFKRSACKFCLGVWICVVWHECMLSCVKTEFYCLFLCSTINKEQFSKRKNDTLDPEL